MKRTMTVALFLLVLPVVAQTPKKVVLPALTIDGSSVDVTVTYDAPRSVYRYEYRINAAQANKAPISTISIDVNGRTARAQIDPDLTNNVMRSETRATRPITPQPLTSLPVGMIAPNPRGTVAGVSMDGRAVFAGFTWGVAPGASLGGFVLESKFPPGPRTVKLSPSDEAWLAIEEQHEGSEVEFEGEGQRLQYDIEVPSVGPSEIADADLYDGGGQQPAEVNKFLRRRHFRRR